MEVDHSLIDKYLSGATSPEETVAVLAAVAVDPELEEYAVSQMRLDYEEDRLNEYDSFIPAGSMAADGDSNLCDFQCELFILRREGETVDGEEAMQVSRRNYWLRTLGTPLYNMGRLLESRGFLVSRIYGADLGRIEECLADKAVIAVVNGDVLEPGRGDGAVLWLPVSGVDTELTSDQSGVPYPAIRPSMAWTLAVTPSNMRFM